MNRYSLKYLKQARESLFDAKRYCDNKEDKYVIEQLIERLAFVIGTSD